MAHIVVANVYKQCIFSPLNMSELVNRKLWDYIHVDLVQLLAQYELFGLVASPKAKSYGWKRYVEEEKKGSPVVARSRPKKYGQAQLAIR